MSDKRKDFFGKKVSKSKVLEGLGDPAIWGKNERNFEFKKRLVYGNKELDIRGIKGLFCDDGGYLGYLKKCFETPFGSDTGLLSESENARIVKQERKVLKKEIQKYFELLKKLEKSPEAVKAYISDMKYWLAEIKKWDKIDPKKYSDQEMKESIARSNRAHDRIVTGLEKEIEKYEKLLEELKKSA